MTPREQELYLMRQYLSIDLNKRTRHQNTIDTVGNRAGLFNQGICRAKLKYLLDNKIISFKGADSSGKAL